MRVNIGSDATDRMRMFALGGAIVAAVGTTVPWAKATVIVGASDTVNGYKFWEGKALLVFAAFMALRAFLHRPGGRRNMSPLIALGGAVIAGLAVWFVIGHQSQLTNDLTRGLVDQRGGDIDTVKAAVEKAIDSGALVFSAQIGVYVSILGGLLGLAGGLIGVRAGRPERSATGVADARTAETWLADPVAPAAQASGTWADGRTDP